MDRFIMTPVEILTDTRLSQRQMRVLLALFSHRNKVTDLVWPKREKLSQMLGYTVNQITDLTTDLVKLGWLVKEGNGGREKANFYKLVVPDLTKTHPESGCETHPESGCETHPESGCSFNEEQTKEQTKEQKKKNTKENFSEKQILQALGIVGQLAVDFVKHRQRIKAPITETAMAGFLREADKARWRVEDAVRESIERGWRGFKADWVNQPAVKPGGRIPESFGGLMKSEIEKLARPGESYEQAAARINQQRRGGVVRAVGSVVMAEGGQYGKNTD